MKDNDIRDRYIEGTPDAIIKAQENLETRDKKPKILGILSIVLSPLVVASMILGIIGCKKSFLKSDKRLNIAGIILSIIFTILWIVGVVLFLVGVVYGLFTTVTQGTVDAIVGQ